MGVRSFARCWTMDRKERRIRVNLVSPGSIDTTMMRSTPHFDSFVAEIAHIVPMNCLGKSDTFTE